MSNTLFTKLIPTSIPSGIGFAFIIYSAIKLALFSSVYLRPSNLPRYLRSEGAYALITGASDGIGLACAEELLSRGFSVILHGRNADKLFKIQNRLKSEFPSRKIEVFICDASRHDISRTISDFVHSIKDKPLTILVNNVANVPTTPAFMQLESNTPEQLDMTMNASARFQMQITRAVLPILSANQPSLIINMGSILTITSAPFLSVLGSCKSFNVTFSRSLRLEMQLLGKDVEVLGLQIGAVTKEKTSFLAGLSSPSTRPFAKAVLARVGCGESVVWPWMPHAFIGWVTANLVPESNLKSVFQERIEAERLKVEKKGK